MTCASFLQPFADWVKGAAFDEDRHLALILVSNDKGGPARYAEGSLYVKTLTFQGLEVSSFEGEAELYESNERWGYPPQDPGAGGGFTGPSGNFPFDPNKTDKIQVHIDVSTDQVKLTSTTKGQAIIGNPQCADSLLFGFATEGSGALGVGGAALQLVNQTSLSGTVASEASKVGSIGQGTGPIPSGHSFPIPVPIAVVRPYYVLSFQQITVKIPH